MAVINFREVLPRTFQHKFGDAPRGTRKFIATLDEPTPHQTILNAIGIVHGSLHPEYTYLNCTNGAVNETDRQHAEVTYDYELLRFEFQQNPLLRPDVWSFSVGGATVPAIFYYDLGDERKPLTNSAKEFIENATTEEAEIRATISGNRASFPLDLAAYVANTVNDGPYLGGVSYTWKCTGISGQQAAEDVNGIVVRYYQISSELVYRASGWPLVLPDVGFNYLENNSLKRAFVEVTLESGEVERVPSATAVPLAADGRMLPPGNECRLLVRRVNRAVPFGNFFGEPQF
jgi:hypothetical protein